MNIITKQQLMLDNLLSYKTRVEKHRLPELIRFAAENIDAMDLRKCGDTIFSIQEEISEPGISIVDVELLIPVDRSFGSSVRYVFKPVFRLENAVLMKYCGTFSGLSDAKAELAEYLARSGFQPLTKAYCVVRNQSGENCVLDIMIGINGNSL